MKYVRVPEELSSKDLAPEESCFSPGRYVRFDRPKVNGATHYAPLDKLVVVRQESRSVRKQETYRYAEIGDINVDTGSVSFRELKGFRLPTQRPARAETGDVLVSTVRTYRKGIGLVTESGSNLVTTNAMLNLCAVTDFAPAISLPYVYAFLRSDFFVEQVWSLLHRGVYPRMDTGALGKIVLPVSDSKDVCQYVAALSTAILQKEDAIKARHSTGLFEIAQDLARHQSRKFAFEFPSSKRVLDSARMDAGFWSPPLREQLHSLATYGRGAFESIYAAGFKTRRGPNLAVSVSGPAFYSDTPLGNALPMATPGDISDYMTIPAFRYYGNRRKVDTVRHGEIMFAGKGVREVSIGHTWVNLGNEPFVTNFDSFLIHSPDRTRSVFLAFLLSYLKSIGVFAKLSDTSNGGSFVQSHFHALPIPKFEESFQERIAKLYHSDAPPPTPELTLANLVAWHGEWNTRLGIWELDRELKTLQRNLSNILEEIIEGRTVTLPF